MGEVKNGGVAASMDLRQSRSHVRWRASLAVYPCEEFRCFQRRGLQSLTLQRFVRGRAVRYRVREAGSSASSTIPSRFPWKRSL
eukprot:scaffold944_cov333-Pavlova_lutheri.AAC.9